MGYKVANDAVSKPWGSEKKRPSSPSLFADPYCISGGQPVSSFIEDVLFTQPVCKLPDQFLRNQVFAPPRCANCQMRVVQLLPAVKH